VCGLSVHAAREIPVFTQGCKYCIGDFLCPSSGHVHVRGMAEY